MSGSLAIPTTFATAPGGTDPVATLDTNFTTVRDYINNREVTVGLFANRPAAGTHGATYFATDVGGGTLYLDSGVAWLTIASTAAVGTLANRPAFGTAGRTYFATNVGAGVLYVDTGTAWISIPVASTNPNNFVAANTVVETTIFTLAIPANTLGASGKLRLTVIARVTDTGPTAGTYTLRLKYGATTLCTKVITTSRLIACAFNGIGANVAHKIVAELDGAGATNAQQGSLVDTGGQRFTDGTTLEFAATAQGTAAEDSTAATTLALTVQWSVAEAGKSFTGIKAVLEVVIG